MRKHMVNRPPTQREADAMDSEQALQKRRKDLTQ